MEEIIKIIEVHKQTGRYISCLENLFVLFEKNSISYSDRKQILKEVYEHNQMLHNKEKIRAQEISKIDIPKKVKFKSIEEKEPEKKAKKIPEPLICDVSMYLDKIKNITNVDEIISVLPGRDNPDFDDILSMILISLHKEKVEIINFLNQQEDKKEIIDIFESELEQKDLQMEVILDYKENMFETSIPETENENKIVFMKNSMGEPVIFNNLKGYEEYYETFLELLNSIIDGSFKNSRTFKNNARLVNILEVKKGKTRILFTRIKDDIYAVISAFVKKCDTDLRHRNFIVNSSQAYYDQKDILLNNIANEKYMEQEEKYLSDLKEMLSERMKVKKNEFDGKN